MKTIYFSVISGRNREFSVASCLISYYAYSKSCNVPKIRTSRREKEFRNGFALMTIFLFSNTSFAIFSIRFLSFIVLSFHLLYSWSLCLCLYSCIHLLRHRSCCVPNHGKWFTFVVFVVCGRFPDLLGTRPFAAMRLLWDLPQVKTYGMDVNVILSRGRGRYFGGLGPVAVR